MSLDRWADAVKVRAAEAGTLTNLQRAAKKHVELEPRAAL